MNKSIIRYVGIAVLVTIAFVLFMNTGKTTYPYRVELKSLQSENQLSTDIFVKSYRAFELDGAYDIQGMEKQLEQLDWYVDRYNDLEELPEEALEDYAILMGILDEQKEVYLLIYHLALEEESIPGEYALQLKKVVEQRQLYEGRMGRY